MIVTQSDAAKADHLLRKDDDYDDHESLTRRTERLINIDARGSRIRGRFAALRWQPRGGDPGRQLLISRSRSGIFGANARRFR